MNARKITKHLLVAGLLATGAISCPGRKEKDSLPMRPSLPPPQTSLAAAH